MLLLNKWEMALILRTFNVYGYLNEKWTFYVLVNLNDAKIIVASKNENS